MTSRNSRAKLSRMFLLYCRNKWSRNAKRRGGSGADYWPRSRLARRLSSNRADCLSCFFSRSPKNRALASAHAPFGSGGFQESNDRRSGEMAPRSAETSFQTSFSSPSSASFAPFSFFRESQRHSSVAKNLSASSPRLGFPISRGKLAPRLPLCFRSQPSASSTLLRMRVSFPLKRRNVVLVSKPSFSLSVLNLLPRGYLVFLGSTLHPGTCG